MSKGYLQFEIRFRQHEEERRRCFAGWSNSAVFAVALARRAEVFLSVPGWWPLHDTTRLPYAPTPPVLSYCTSIHKNCQDDKGCVEIITQMENALMRMTCFFPTCLNGNLSHSFGHFQFDHHRGCFLVPLPVGVLEDLHVFDFYDVIQLDGYDPVFYLLARCRL